jgi:molybdopterin converting factor small subunit
LSIEVRIPTVFRKFTDGAPTTQVEPGTLREVVGQLTERHPGFGEQVLTAEGELHRYVNVYVNDEDARYLDKLDTEVKEGDVISLLPSVAGGSAGG